MGIEKKKEELKKLLKIEEKEKRVAEINSMMSQPDFWNERDRAVQITQELTGLQEIIKRWERAEDKKDIEELELEAMFTGEYDTNNAIMMISAGAGGTEAQDWAEMLSRMYIRYAEKMGYKVKILDKSVGEEAGVKSITLEIKGLMAYGYLKAEDGVHRLVRLSPFDADHARHTSFAAVEVMPELKDKGEIEIGEKDLKIDVFRSSGHGGQSVNTTDSAVRVTHIPSRIVVSCQNERSQLQNKITAINIIKAKLIKLEIDKKKAKERELIGEHEEAAWGNQIRSYVLHPYKMVKDLRTGYETSDTEGVLGGGIEKFIEIYLRQCQMSND